MLITRRRLLFSLLVAAISLAACGISQAEQSDSISPTGAVKQILTGFAFTEGPAVTSDGTLYFTDIPNATIHQFNPNGFLRVFTDQSRHANGLWPLSDGGLLACEMDGAVVRYNLADGSREVLTDSYEGVRYNACNDLVVDASGGIYFTDPHYRAPTPLPQKVRAVYYRSSDGKVSRLTGDLAAPNGIGLSLDEKTLYVIPSMQSEMLAFDIEQPGKISGQRTFCRLAQPEGTSGTGGDGMAMDERGNLYITTHLGVQIFSPAGEPLGTVAFAERPANVTFGGDDFKMMVVTAQKSVYAVPMPIAGSRRGK
ncbi:SMP-30/gluconolactonase/LRE family protein [Aporhodopirellula aestuarii]|uniref:SMP-30/gluconolactonase/LRE family protein n=1 Tax=Aporhodopirellula aestuarii TaxID=2950107 RepID=A0ABT0UAD9_9BACT|nr:SMP-30/gluconolactonase/LRE family protein [Aporhodopirellula aestuarii]MCM2373343.1 SMP-30/gluconolactonase/LRE family protein [Aporhodopirellula aestuarii]